jgi:hypothetical protein
MILLAFVEPPYHPAPAPMIVSYLWSSTLLTISVALAFAFALSMVRWHYAWYDDEGFMLMTLRQFTGGTPLYDGMYTEYGPFHYVSHAALFRLAGWAVDHDHIRWVAIMSWFFVSAAWAACVWTWRRSLHWALAALLATTVVLRALDREPGHPQLLILV